MKPQITIKLREPLKSPHGDVHEIILREPNVWECIRIGDPVTIAQSETGALVPVENAEVIEAYLNRLLVEPKDSAILYQGGVAVARQIKQAIFSFFRSDAEAGEASVTSPTSSPSAASAAAPATSAG